MLFCNPLKIHRSRCLFVEASMLPILNTVTKTFTSHFKYVARDWIQMQRIL